MWERLSALQLKSTLHNYKSSEISQRLAETMHNGIYKETQLQVWMFYSCELVQSSILWLD